MEEISNKFPGNLIQDDGGNFKFVPSQNIQKGQYRLQAMYRTNKESFVIYLEEDKQEPVLNMKGVVKVRNIKINFDEPVFQEAFSYFSKLVKDKEDEIKKLSVNYIISQNITPNNIDELIRQKQQEVQDKKFEYDQLIIEKARLTMPFLKN